MARSNPMTHPAGGGPAEVFLFGIPIGQLGWFATVLMGTAAGFAAFFATTFLGIVGLLLVGAVSHSTPDYALAYKRIGFPAGMVVLVGALAFLISLRLRRGLRKGW